MDRLRALLLHVLLPLAAGGAIYLGWRERSLLGWSWAEAIGIEEGARGLRIGLRAIAIDLPEPILFTLPDALWVYALTFVLAGLHAGSGRSERALFLSIPLLLGPGAELLQLARCLPGTFDPLDLLATCAALAAGLVSSGARDRSRRAPLSSVRALEPS